LAELRKLKGLSQAKLSEKSGVHRVTIARFETGKILPNFRTLQKLSAALGVSIADIVSDGQKAG
jgi:transcriptional regulator with XRE-family HTH domain